MASKSNRSALPETPHKKTSLATPTRISKLGRVSPKIESDIATASPSHHSSRVSLDRPASRSGGSRTSLDTPPKSVAMRSLADRKSPRLTTPPEKIHDAKELENQAKFNDLQEELKKAKEQLLLLEKEKAQAVSELKDANKQVDVANEKLSEALFAQKRAEEDSEIEKFRALEIEQVGTEITQKKEEEWMKEIETIKSQHAIDVSALLSTTLELQQLKEELSMTSDAKNQAMCHADDAMKIAELHAEKAGNLSQEINVLKALLESKVESETNAGRIESELKSEVEILKQELEKSVILEGKIAEQDAALEQISIELEAARMVELYACSLVQEGNDRIESVIAEASQSERLASQALDTVSKQLEDNECLLRESESILKENINLLKTSLEKQKKTIEESEQRAVLSSEEVIQLSQTVKSLTVELQIMQEEKLQAQSNEKLAALDIEKLVEDKNILVRDLEVAKDEYEKCRTAMESLAEALHEVSLEAREAKEDLQLRQAENNKLENEIEGLNDAIKVAKENYESMLDDAKHEIEVITKKIEQSYNVFEDSKTEWVQKEVLYAENLKCLEHEKLSAYTEIHRLEKALKEAEGEALAKREEASRLNDSLKKVEEEALAQREEASRLSDSLKKAESKANRLHGSLDEMKTVSLRLEQTLMDKETELKLAIQKNEELRNQEAVYLSKIEELTNLLKEANATKMAKEIDDLSDTDKDYDLLPKVVEFSVENGNANGRKSAVRVEHPSPELHEYKKIEKEYGSVDRLLENSPIRNLADHESQDEDLHDNIDDKRKFMMWESCKIDEKDYSSSRETEHEHESLNEDADSKLEGSDNFDQIDETIESLDDGSSSLSKRPKKKKALLSKFGSLLKKKGSPNMQK